MKKHIILFIRGHIRNAFDDNLFAVFVKTLCSIYNVKIYIHSWNVYQNNVSWRTLDENNNVVTEELIRDYFQEVNENIVSITIDDDKKIELIGNLEGSVCSSRIPTVGWKRMWYGKFKTLEKIKLNESENDVVINTRFDLFTNSCAANYSNVLLFLKQSLINNQKRIGNEFHIYPQHKLCGCDNFYIGSPTTMYLLAHIFHHNLDKVDSMYKELGYPEYTVIYINNILFVNHLSSCNFEVAGWEQIIAPYV
jgi:hypothetical protein